jgi:hypothetical protein
MSSPVLSARAPVSHASRRVSSPPPRALAAGSRSRPGLAVGMRVQLRDGSRLTGTVMSYQRECLPGLLGLFPVRLDNAIWQTCHANDVTVLAPATETQSVTEVRPEAGK